MSFVTNAACCSDPNYLCPKCKAAASRKPEPMPVLNWEAAFEADAGNKPNAQPAASRTTHNRSQHQPAGGSLGLPVWNW